MIGRAISVRLVTLCGCQKFMAVPGTAPDFIDVPIAAADVDQTLRNRRFRLARLSPDDVSVEADYHEMPE